MRGCDAGIGRPAHQAAESFEKLPDTSVRRGEPQIGNSRGKMQSEHRLRTMDMPELNVCSRLTAQDRRSVWLLRKHCPNHTLSESFHESRSSIWFSLRQLTIATSVAASRAWGSTPFILQVSMSEAMTARFSAPASRPVKRAFFRFRTMERMVVRRYSCRSTHGHRSGSGRVRRGIWRWRRVPCPTVIWPKLGRDDGPASRRGGRGSGRSNLAVQPVR